jgi:hypothetical protein
MTSQKSSIALALLILVSALTTSAQQAQGTNPLILFFQSNFDSTLIHNSWSSWHQEPNYRIVAKKDDKVYFFTYRSPYAWTSGRSFPGQLMHKFMEDQLRFERTKPDTNRYFLPVFVQFEKRMEFWENINRYKIWNAQEVQYEPGGCDVDDGRTDTFYLIIEKFVRILEFYSPDFYETCKTPNVHRQTAIQTRKAFERAFDTCH